MLLCPPLIGFMKNHCESVRKIKFQKQYVLNNLRLTSCSLTLCLTALSKIKIKNKKKKKMKQISSDSLHNSAEDIVI